MKTPEQRQLLSGVFAVRLWPQLSDGFVFNFELKLICWASGSLFFRPK